MDPIASLLESLGPVRSSVLAKRLCDDFQLTPEAARKRLSRVRPPIRRYPVSLLPKREAFFYHQSERETERFWSNLVRDMRETESGASAAMDGLQARGGIVSADEFAVISGAPIRQLKQVPTALVLKRLKDANIVMTATVPNLGGEMVMLRGAIGYADYGGFKGRRLAEGVLLDGVREWARRLGLASYNSIAIRGDDHPRMVGPYKWDLTGPSYLMPLKGMKGDVEQQGFLVADVFVGEALDQHQIRYFIRKASSLRATTKVGSILPLIVAQGFSSDALKQGHKAGLMMATPETLFGSRTASAFESLVDVLRNAGGIVAYNPDRLIDLLERLQDIEGKAGNLRGILFELVCAYLVRNDGGSVDLGRKAFDQTTGKYADIDVMLVRGKAECVLYECKGKAPGGTVSQKEIEDWIRRLPIFISYIRSQPNLSGITLRCEMWTSGVFEPEALEILHREKQGRTKVLIDWKDGKEVRAFSVNFKEKAVTDAFDQHFLKHPLN